MPHVYARLSDELIEDIRAKYLAGEKTEMIAVELGVSSFVVRKHTSDLPRRQPADEKKRLAVLELAEAGVWPREIAARLRLSMRTVLHALRSAPEKRAEDVKGS